MTDPFIEPTPISMLPLQATVPSGDTLIPGVIRNPNKFGPGVGGWDSKAISVLLLAQAAQLGGPPLDKILELGGFDYLGFGTTTGSADAYLLTVPGTKTTYAHGQYVGFKANFDNSPGVTFTSAADVTISITNGNAVALGVKVIREDGDEKLASRSIQSGGHYLARYDSAANGGTGAWILLNPSRSSITGRFFVYPIASYNRNNWVLIGEGTGPNGEGPFITTYYQEGPIGAPVTTPAGRELGGYQFQAWDGVSFGSGNPLALVAVGIQTYTPTHHGAGWLFQSIGFDQAVAQNELCVVDGLTALDTNEFTQAGQGLGTINAKKGLYDRGIRLSTALQNYLSGLTLSWASTTTFTVAVGAAADSTNTQFLNLASAITKSTSAWVVGSGNGGLDTGSIANNTWYHVYLIRRPDTSVVAVLFSTSASAPTMPTNYTQKRRIGSVLTNGSAQFVKFIQNGDIFTWDIPVINNNATANPGTSAILRAVTTPLGVQCEAIIHSRSSTSTASSAVATIYTDPAQTDTVPDFNNSQQIGNTSLGPFANLRIRTDTSSQIRVRLNFSDALVQFTLATDGWVDRRGRDG